MKTLRAVALFLGLVGFGTYGIAQTTKPPTITPDKAKEHIGETATVCGKVASTRYAAPLRGSPTFLNLDRPYPHHVFTVVIWGEDRSKFDKPEVTYRGQLICVTGKIGSYRGVPQIVVRDPKQIEVRKEEDRPR